MIGDDWWRKVAVAESRVSLKLLFEGFAQRFHLIVQMADHGTLREVGVFCEKGVHDLVVLADRIVESKRQMERENSRFLSFLAEVIDRRVKPLGSRDFGEKAMEVAVGLEVGSQV